MRVLIEQIPEREMKTAQQPKEIIIQSGE